MELKGKTALITGATGKIGRALTEALAREGVHCICHFHRQKETALVLVRQAEELGCRGMAVGADFQAESQIKEMFRQAHSMGPVDLLIHAAGLFAPTPIEEGGVGTERTLMEVNLTGPLLLTRLFVESLKDQQGPNPVGKVLYFADAAAVRPWKKYSVYCAAKAGLAAAVKSLAKELAPAVTVNAIAPGVIEGTGLGPQEEERQLAKIPMGRFGTLEEVTMAVLFLLKNDYITGHVLPLDGGRVL
jgi:NAD(P)-dependent dehydrogenase (short-subunit alcohol dehydrogenase family)